MKTAIVHDWLMSLGGAERVLEEILGLFPSPLFTLCQNKEARFSDNIQQAATHHSFIQKLPFTQSHYRHYLSLYPRAIEGFDLENYDLIISSSHAVAKGVKTHENQLHVCYCHTPMRYIWDLEEQYLKAAGPLTAIIARQVFKTLRKWDVETSSRVDAFIANSQFVAERIHRLYGQEASVIYPPVATHLFSPQKEKDDFYLSVSRLVPYKRIDLLIDAFNQSPERRLKIVGTGPLLEELQKRARANIEFLGFQSDENVRKLLSDAKGFVFAAEEDFGIAPLEAQASGTPVIAYGRGGALETIVEGKTGIFFHEQTASHLLGALDVFEKTTWDYSVICSHAEKFGTDRFRKELKQFVNQHWEVFCEKRHSSRR
jgi:glycosyltransferase involved in cell wall biosynthesis